jgi:hypothetical protein
VTKRTTTSREAAEAAFKAATTKPVELPPKRPSVSGVKEQVSLRIDRSSASSVTAGVARRLYPGATSIPTNQGFFT